MSKKDKYSELAELDIVPPHDHQQFSELTFLVQKTRDDEELAHQQVTATMEKANAHTDLLQQQLAEHGHPHEHAHEHEVGQHEHPLSEHNHGGVAEHLHPKHEYHLRGHLDRGAIRALLAVFTVGNLNSEQVKAIHAVRVIIGDAHGSGCQHENVVYEENDRLICQDCRGIIA